MKISRLFITIFGAIALAGCTPSTPCPSPEPCPSPTPAHTHVDDNNDHLCDTCSEKISECKDSNNDHLCDICFAKVSDCKDENKDHKCDICGKTLSTCKDTDKDHLCDVCFEKVSDCKDDNKDHKCDICGKTLSICKDTDKDHLCDVCGKTISQHADLDFDHKCDICGDILSNHSDEDHNHKCDYCGIEVSQCRDNDKDHKCDICGEVLSECKDENHDHHCDICGEVLSECKDENPKDHNCDICGSKISDCEDKNNDDYCDICGKKIEFKCYFAFATEDYEIKSDNKLTQDLVEDNLYSKVKTFHKGDIIKVLNSSGAFTNFDTNDSDTKNAFKQNLIKQATTEKIQILATGNYRITVDHADSNKITIEYTTVTSYKTVEVDGNYTEYGSLVFCQSDPNPDKLVYKKTNQIFVLSEWFYIKDPEGNFVNFTLSSDTWTTYFEFNQRDGYAAVQYLKPSKKDKFDITLTVDVVTDNLVVDFHWTAYNEK